MIVLNQKLRKNPVGTGAPHDGWRNLFAGSCCSRLPVHGFPVFFPILGVLLSDVSATGVKRKSGSNPIHKYPVGLEGDSGACVWTVWIGYAPRTCMRWLYVFVRKCPEVCSSYTRTGFSSLGWGRGGGTSNMRFQNLQCLPGAYHCWLVPRLLWEQSPEETVGDTGGWFGFLGNEKPEPQEMLLGG